MLMKDQLVQHAEDGSLTWEAIARAALTYMTDDAITDMASCEELIADEELDATYKVYRVSEDGSRQEVIGFKPLNPEDEDGAIELAEGYAGYHELHCIVVEITDNGGEKNDKHEFDFT